jgi:hypothetical protein
MRIYLQYFQVHYNIIVRTRHHSYPRYFKLEFAFRRVAYQAHPRSMDPAKMELRSKVIELRSQGWGFATIARHFDISVGTAWNMVKGKL